MAPAPPTSVRRARTAVAAVFLTNGALFANVVPRYPAIKNDLELSNAAWGTVLAAFPLGALIAGLLAAALIGRVGSARVASFGIVVLAVALLGVALAPTPVALAGVLFVAGAVDALVDVGQNAHGLRVQRLYRRSIVNSFHGLWSVGSVVGGLMGAAAAGLHVPLGVHLAVAGVIFGAVALTAFRFMLTGPEHAERDLDRSGAVAAATASATEGDAVVHSPDAVAHNPSAVAHDPSADSHDPNASAPPRGLGTVPRASVTALAVLGLLAISGALVEDAGSSWSAVYLRGSLDADAATAGLAFVALAVAMTVGRLTGDRAVDRFGQSTVARWGGVLTAVGIGLAVAVPSLPTTIGGFALAGLGVATLVPATMQAADDLPGLRPGVGLTILSWLLRVGFLLSPPLVGLIADATSLRLALLVVAVGGVLTASLGGVLARRRP